MFSLRKQYYSTQTRLNKLQYHSDVVVSIPFENEISYLEKRVLFTLMYLVKINSQFWRTEILIHNTQNPHIIN